MFGKKFLSFIGLLLIGNQFVNVLATAPASGTFIDDNGSLHSGDSSNTGIFAFKNFESDKKYKILLSEAEIDALTDVNGVFLYDCLQSTCKLTSGYIKYHSGEKFADCDEYGCEEDSLDNGSSDNGSSSNGGTEVGYANLMENTMRLCIADGVLVGSTEAAGRIGYIIDDILYKINTSGSIIGESQQDESYIDTENGNELITCTNSLCERDEDAAGYYFVYKLSDSSEKKLYSCISGSCTAVDNESISCLYSTIGKERCNGYYLIRKELKFCTLGICEGPLNIMGYFKSPNGQYIKCTSNRSTITCEYITLGEDKCVKGNLIDNSGDIGLCINNIKTDIVPIFNTKKDRYFIDASILYPGISNNKYYMISIDINSVKVEIIPKDSPEEYLYTFGNRKILVQKENQCTNTEGTKIDNLIEFKKSDDEDNTYSIIPNPNPNPTTKRSNSLRTINYY